MAKNRNKKRNAAVSMDTTEVIVSDIPQGTPSIEKKNEKKSFWILNLCYTIFSFIAEVKFKLIYLFFAAMDTSESVAKNSASAAHVK